MQIKTKFIGSAFLIMTLTILLSGGRALLMQRAEQTLAEQRQRSEQTTSAILDLNLALQDELAIAQQSILLNLQTDHWARYQKAFERFNQELALLQQVIPESDTVAQTQLEALEHRHKTLNQLIVPLLQDSQEGIDLQQMLRALNTYEQGINIYLWELLDSSKSWTYKLNLKFDQLRRWTQTLEILILGLIVGLLVLQVQSIFLPVLRALNHLQAGAKLLGQGQRQHRLKITTNDEMAQLATTFNHMAEQLDQAYQGLEQKVTERTSELATTNRILEQEICDRVEAEANLKSVVKQLQRTQIQLVQTEKMSSLGQLVAGIAHEINNPVSFIAGNLAPTEEYTKDLLTLIQRYQREHLTPSPELQDLIKQIDLPYLQKDFPKVLRSMQTGVDRISQIVQSLKTFSRLDESEIKTVDIHTGLDSTLTLLEARFKGNGQHPPITIVKKYCTLPKIQCYAGQLNQVFMQILVNAVDALEEQWQDNPLGKDPQSSTAQSIDSDPKITIRTEATAQAAVITIADNGPGIPEPIKAKIFDPFFTTKQVGKGTGLGLSMSYQIIVGLHRGNLRCYSKLGQGTTLTIQIPLILDESASSPPALMTVG